MMIRTVSYTFALLTSVAAVAAPAHAQLLGGGAVVDGLFSTPGGLIGGGGAGGGGTGGGGGASGGSLIGGTLDATVTKTLEVGGGSSSHSVGNLPHSVHQVTGTTGQASSSGRRIPLAGTVTTDRRSLVAGTLDANVRKTLSVGGVRRPIASGSLGATASKTLNVGGVRRPMVDGTLGATVNKTLRVGRGGTTGTSPAARGTLGATVNKTLSIGRVPAARGRLVDGTLNAGVRKTVRVGQVAGGHGGSLVKGNLGATASKTLQVGGNGHPVSGTANAAVSKTVGVRLPLGTASGGARQVLDLGGGAPTRNRIGSTTSASLTKTVKVRGTRATPAVKGTLGASATKTVAVGGTRPSGGSPSHCKTGGATAACPTPTQPQAGQTAQNQPTDHRTRGRYRQPMGMYGQFTE